MEPGYLPLYYLSAIAGAVMVVGGIVLLYKQKIYIDRESNQVTEVATPLGRFKTNVPALVLFVLGFVPLIFPIWKIERFTRTVRITGNVDSTAFPIEVYAVVDVDSLPGPGDFSVRVPASGGDYRILYKAGGTLDPSTADLSKAVHGQLQLPDKKFTNVEMTQYEVVSSQGGTDAP